ncbi:MAG TPA: glycerophosphodiester phosphodiesterase family protein [Nitrosomonas mobilis]|nr:glycerophosphodiester phosphodiesterase family protein [Nitrosomonas mobilis]
MTIKPTFIAHRGYPALYPENSLAGIEAAICTGVRHVEIDIQLSNSLTPFLCHDDHLQRLIGRDINLTLLSNAEIENLAVPYPTLSPFANKSEPISRLADFCLYLANHPQVFAFVEIKVESIVRFGLQQTVTAIFDEVYPVRSQCTMISFDSEALILIRKMGMPKIGWVIEQRDETTQVIASRLSPDFLFCDVSKLAATIEEMWRGPWQWVIYSINDPIEAARHANAGFTLIETDDIGAMLGKASTKRDQT